MRAEKHSLTRHKLAEGGCTDPKLTRIKSINCRCCLPRREKECCLSRSIPPVTALFQEKEIGKEKSTDLARKSVLVVELERKKTGRHNDNNKLQTGNKVHRDSRESKGKQSRLSPKCTSGTGGKTEEKEEEEERAVKQSKSRRQLTSLGGGC